ncbi:DUF1684 domain-containing protein [Luteimicrobium xylanilyticum]|uniref:DUF1684 domain-containing protein n=1 Tax=Luteimicrobium xylanilyticum TaxID=1133546 RepID=A0A5P9Q9Q1_9MICO|nr:DUF1684 domain-containing protein [Luteimicrobium xylanilyticum]QFU98157.1 hypothetical protein KDY119_01666 [Luteimicrobium xylanilyticum]
MTGYLELTDWRRRVAELYARVRTRAADDPAAAHADWREGRDRLFAEHPQSPLPPGDPLRTSGLPYWVYDPALRFELQVVPVEPASLTLGTGDDGTTTLERVGRVEVPGVGSLDVWWLAQYGGGLFLPLRDGTAGSGSYGGGRYLLDTAKGADLGGGAHGTLVVDLNFAYHPSCRYDPRWVCPLAPAGNRTTTPVEAGERLT